MSVQFWQKSKVCVQAKAAPVYLSSFSVKKEDSCVLGELNPTPPKILNDKVR